MSDNFARLIVILSVLMIASSSSFSMAKCLWPTPPTSKEIVTSMDIEVGDVLYYVAKGLNHKTRLKKYEVVAFCSKTHRVLVQNNMYNNDIEILSDKKLLKMAIAKDHNKFKIGTQVTDGKSSTGKLLGFYYNGNALLDKHPVTHQKGWLRASEIHPIILSPKMK